MIYSKAGVYAAFRAAHAEAFMRDANLSAADLMEEAVEKTAEALCITPDMVRDACEYSEFSHG